MEAPKDDQTDYNNYQDSIDIANDHGDSDLFGNKSPTFLKERGNTHFKAGEYEEAIEWYTKALLRLEYSDNNVLRAQILCNRAACHQALKSWEASIQDCDDAICFDGSYAKAFVRRSVGYENTKSYQRAFADLKKAIELEPALESKYEARRDKLKKHADVEFEREKTEMMGKLKDFGNTMLGKFGLSLDNFKVNKNENGSYNIQFQQ